MNKVSILSTFLLPFSFIGLLHNPISFGCLILIAITLIFFESREELKSFFLILNNKSLVFSFFTLCVLMIVSSLYSVDIQRSLLVIIYLVSFIFLSFIIYKFLTFNFDRVEFLSKKFLYTVFFIIIFIFFYNIFNTKINENDYGIINYSISEVRRFKGVVNIYALLVCLLPLFEIQIRKIPYLSILSFLLLIPVILISNSNSSFLGILIGLTCVCIYMLLKKISSKKKYFIALFSVFIVFLFIILKFNDFLPKINEEQDINQTVFVINPKIIDIHRQFIWSFSIDQIKENYFFGIGPDTSNFIPGGQEVIGHDQTGNMNFLPSHPHNFLIELLLEIGLFGTFSFFLFVMIINTQFLERYSNKYNFYLIFFNGYFWGSSLVNFSFWNAWWQGSYFLLLAIILANLKYKTKSNNSF